MAELGKVNALRVDRIVDFGAYLEAGDLGDILMPKSYLPKDVAVDDVIDAFIYRDNEGRLICTTQTPKAQVEELALMRCKEVTTHGAFLDWGIHKDLFVPYREQVEHMQAEQNYLVFVYLDEESDRIVASSKLYKFLEEYNDDFEVGQEVDLQICAETPIGYRAVINDSYLGMLYKNETFQRIDIGQKTKGYIKRIREDEKIDLSLERFAYQKIGDIAQRVLNALKENQGFLPLHDKSSALLIKDKLGISKKSFKKAIGSLYKQRLISIEQKGIRLK